MRETIPFSSLLISSLIFSQETLSQAACPPGTIPYGTGTGVNMCGPDNTQPQQPTQPDFQPPPPRWVSRWGAIATDIPHSAAGAAVDEKDEQAAIDGALKNCRSNGGVACKVEISYSNGCAALVLGRDGHKTKAGSAIAEEKARAMNVCNAADKGCSVYSTGCSLPVMTTW